MKTKWVNFFETKCRLENILQEIYNSTLPRFFWRHLFAVWDGTLAKESELCRLESEGRRQLRSSGRSQLAVPRYNLATVGRRAFGYEGPKAWNALPDYLRCSELNIETFK